MTMKIGNGIGMIVFEYLCKLATTKKIEKTKWMNKNIVKD